MSATGAALRLAAPLLLLAACNAGNDPLVELFADPGEVDLVPTAEGWVQADFALANTGEVVIEVEALTLEGDGAEALRLIADRQLPTVLQPGEVYHVRLRVDDPDAFSALSEGTLTLTATGEGEVVHPGGCSSWLEKVPVELVLPVSVAPGGPACDADGDGALAEACGGDDCDDLDPSRAPGQEDLCDGVDNNCDGELDEDADLLPWYPDNDGDGAAGGEAELACAAPPGWQAEATDCDDADPFTRPGAVELCDDLDNDCDGEIDEGSTPVAWHADADRDGFGDPSDAITSCARQPGRVLDATDCDDAAALVFPGALEVCNAVDDDCDGTTDEPDAVDAASWYPDADGDGYGVDLDPVVACAAPPGRVLSASDCDDANPALSPGAAEVCNGVDDNCDGLVDNGAAPLTWFADDDGDGFGDPGDSVAACFAPPGYIAQSGDCDDARADVAPGLLEVCDGADNDCDGTIDEDPSDGLTFFTDADSDTFGDAAAPVRACVQPPGTSTNDQDCDDAVASTFPGAPESCNGVDDDCDGTVDDDPVDPLTWFADADGDGFGDPSVSATACAAPLGFVADGTDCDDTDPGAFPNALELCDGVDNDCDGEIDEDAVDPTAWYADTDDDGFGDPDSELLSCEPPGDGFVEDDTDCDDADPFVNPDADELCDGIDNDCSGAIDDDAIDGDLYFADADGDGFGDTNTPQVSCDPLPGFVEDDTDCDDADPNVFPNALERCNGVDDDCDGTIDEDVVDASPWFADADGDTFGDASVSELACEAPPGFVADDTDCDDADPTVNPGAPEVCDGADNDCDAQVDEDAVDAGDWFADADRDGFGDPGDVIRACIGPAGRVGNADDCDDTNGAINPDALEICDGVDQDCDGLVDDDPTDGSTWFTDADGDSFGDGSAPITACAQPPGTSDLDTDCDDADPQTFPGAPERCDDADNDCDGTVDEDAIDPATWFADGDGDSFGDAARSVQACDPPAGFIADDRDCDDTNAAINPAAAERCNGLDDNCNGIVDDNPADATPYYTDADGDSFGNPATEVRACRPPSPRHVLNGDDCDDTRAAINPAAREACDALDNDCSGLIDDGNDCPCPVEYLDDSNAYAVCTVPLNWANASTACTLFGYHMLTVGDAAEDGFVEGLRQAYGGGSWWLGYTDRAVEGTWRWVDATNTGYTNWGAGEPNDSGGNEDCAELGRFGTTGTWNDASCALSRNFICEAR